MTSVGKRARRPDAAVDLGHLALFADLSRPELHEIDRLMDEEFFDEGRRAVRSGIRGSNFYVIVDGEARAELAGTEVGRLGVGDYFGDDALLLDEAPAFDVVAVSPLTCRVLGAGQFEEFMRSHPQVMYRMLQSEARRRRESMGGGG